VGLCIVVESMT